MTKPTIGRVVHYTQPDDQEPRNATRVHPAMITRVWNDTCVNLVVFFDAGSPQALTSVTKLPGYNGGGWDWPRIEG